MAKPKNKCPEKYCRNEAATCEKHGGRLVLQGGAGGGTTKPSAARVLKQPARRPEAAAAAEQGLTQQLMEQVDGKIAELQALKAVLIKAEAILA